MSAGTVVILLLVLITFDDGVREQVSGRIVGPHRPWSWRRRAAS